MRTVRFLILAAALAAPLPAAADLSPAALWQRWQEQAAAAGSPLTAEVEEGATLGLRGLTFSRALGPGTITLRIDRVTLAQDGEDVRVTLPGAQEVTLTRSVPDTPDSVAVFETGAGAVMATAVGTLAAHDYAVEARTFSARLIELTEGGTPVEAEMRFDLAGLAGTLSGLDGAGGPVAADLTARALTSAVSARDAATGDAFRNTAAQQDVALRAELSGGQAAPTLAARMEGSGGSSVSTQTGARGDLEIDTQQQTSRLALDIGPGRTDYTAAVTGMASTLSGSALPAGPLSLSMAAADLALSAPTAPGTEAQAARLSLGLADVMPGEALWALIDPQGALPRTPGQLDLAAEADIAALPPGAQFAGPGALPAIAPRALRIQRLALDFAGTQLDAEGAFSLPEGPGGVPDLSRPVGTLDVRAEGVGGLLERAIAGGLVSPEQAMGAQMMLGMFAVPGEGDTFTSTIEGREDGALLVNGNRLR